MIRDFALLRFDIGYSPDCEMTNGANAITGNDGKNAQHMLVLTIVRLALNSTFGIQLARIKK